LRCARIWRTPVGGPVRQVRRRGGAEAHAALKPTTIGVPAYRDDVREYLVAFYNHPLKCFVPIDLKIGELTHQDIGQVDGQEVKNGPPNPDESTGKPACGAFIRFQVGACRTSEERLRPGPVRFLLFDAVFTNGKSEFSATQTFGAILGNPIEVCGQARQGPGLVGVDQAVPIAIE
jgi:hypothetical protein